MKKIHFLAIAMLLLAFTASAQKSNNKTKSNAMCYFGIRATISTFR